MAADKDKHVRSILPIPDVRKPELTAYDAKDPESRFPPIEPVLPPDGAPNVLIVLLDDVGFGSSSAFGGPCETPVAEKLAANGLKYTRFHTCALCSPTRQAMLTGRNHHSVGMGAITEIATAAPGYNSLRPNTKAPLPLTLKLNGYATAQFGKCHEVPAWQTSPMGPFDAWPAGGGGFEHFYGFIGGETNQYDPALYEGLTPVEPPATAEEGYHLTEDMTDRAIGWVQPAEGADAGQAVLRLLRAGRRPRPAPRAEGVGRQVQGPLRPGLGQAPRGDVRAAEGAGRHRAGRRAHAAPRRDPGLGRHARGAQAGARAPDGGLRRVPGAHRPPRRPPGRRPRGPRRAGEHARLLHLRRQRRLRGRHAQRRLQRDVQLQRHGGARDAGVHAVEDRRVRLAVGVQPLLGGLGLGDERAVPVDQAGGVALGRHAQRHDRALAQGHRGARGAASPVHPRDRRGADGPRGRRPAGADPGQRRAAVADGGHQHALQLRRREGARAPRPAVLRDGRQPRHLLQGLERGHQAPDPLDPDGPEAGRLRRRRLGALRREQGLDAGAQPRQGAPGDAAQAAAAVPHRGDQVQRAPARRPGHGALHPRDGRPADAHQGELAAVLPRHGTVAGEQRRQREEPLLHRHRRGRPWARASRRTA